MSLRRGWLQQSHTRPAQTDGDDIVTITENQLDEWVRGNASEVAPLSWTDLGFRHQH